MENSGINFKRYIEIALKRKWLIFIVFIVSIITATLTTLNKPKEYFASATVRRGLVNNTEPIDKQELKLMIEKTEIGSVLEKLQAQGQVIKAEDIIKVQIKNQDSLAITEIMVMAKNAQTAKKICQEITDHYIAYANQIYNNFKKLYEQVVQERNEDLIQTKKYIAGYQHAIAEIESLVVDMFDAKENILQERIEWYKKQIAGTEQSIDEAEKTIKELSSEMSSGALVRKGRIENLQQQLNKYRVELFDLYSKNYRVEIDLLAMQRMDGDNAAEALIAFKDERIYIISLRGYIRSYKKLLENIVSKKLAVDKTLLDMKDYKVIAPVRVLENPLAQNQILIIVVAGMIGLMIGVLMAFFIEYWRNN